MKTKSSLFALLALGVVLAGCATSEKLNDLHIGMTKDQVLGLFGKPDSTTAQANVEYLTYYLVAESGYGRDQPYLVRLVDGKVESFGRFAQLYDLYNRPVTNATPGDTNFPSASMSGPAGPAAMMTPVAVTPQGSYDLAGQIQKLKALRDSGALTEDEFQRAKAKLLGDGK